MLLYPWYLWILASKEARDGAVAASRRLFHWWMCWGRPVTRCVCVLYKYVFLQTEKQGSLWLLDYIFWHLSFMRCWEISAFTNYPNWSKRGGKSVPSLITPTDPREVGNQCPHWALQEWEIGKSMPSQLLHKRLGNQCLHWALHEWEVGKSVLLLNLVGKSMLSLLLSTAWVGSWEISAFTGSCMGNLSKHPWFGLH